MPRDLQSEYDLAVEGLRTASRDYQRTKADCRRRLRAKRAWVVETRRRVRVAEAAISTTRPREAPTRAGA